MTGNIPPPLLSCVIPTLNRANLLKEAIGSIINQTYTDWELLIIDNGSTDNTREVVIEFQKLDNRIKFFRSEKKGPSASRNIGVKNAQGQYIVFLDDDDVSLSHRFGSQLEAIQKSGKEFVVSGYEVRTRSDNRIIQRKINELKGYGAGFPSRWIISKTLFEKAGGFDEELITMEDPEFSYRVAQYEIFACHNEVVTIMYSSPDSISSEGKTLKGKEQMMEKSGKFMHPFEAAWWYFIIGMDYYQINDNISALKYFQIASETCGGYQFRFACYFSKAFLRFGSPLKKINSKILGILGDFRFPILVKHPVI